MTGLKRISRILVFILMGTTVWCQNLVPNPSFEEVNEITTRWAGTHFDFHRWMKEWSSPTQGSVDVLYVQSLDKMHPPRPIVDLSDHLPRTGDFMVGLKTYGCATKTSHCKEYLQIKLKEPLQKGETYAFEYWVNPIVPAVKVNGFGIAVSQRKSEDFWQTQLIALPPIYINPDIIDGPPNEWQRISGTFTADDKYAYIIIGNFGSDDTMEVHWEPDGLDYGYYLLDDVLVRHVPKIELPVLVPDEILVFNHILFAFDKAELQESSTPHLDRLVYYLKENREYTLEVLGHTDAKGGEAYNLVLSQQRADAIKAYLVMNGINTERIRTRGLGTAFPLQNNETEANRRMNRRVEMRISDE